MRNLKGIYYEGVVKKKASSEEEEQGGAKVRGQKQFGKGTCLNVAWGAATTKSGEVQ